MNLKNYCGKININNLTDTFYFSALSFQYTAALVCQKLKTLNLSFLKSMNDTKQTPALKKNSHNVFKPNAFRPSSFHSANRFFVPLFPENKISTGILSEQKESTLFYGFYQN